MSGLSSVGGMVAAAMLFTTSLPAARLRATLIALFFLSSSYGLDWAAERGLVHRVTLLWAVWLVLPMLLGIAIGRRGFRARRRKRTSGASCSACSRRSPRWACCALCG